VEIGTSLSAKEEEEEEEEEVRGSQNEIPR
jgi:hypothetical protein